MQIPRSPATMRRSGCQKMPTSEGAGVGEIGVTGTGPSIHAQRCDRVRPTGSDVTETARRRLKRDAPAVVRCRAQTRAGALPHRVPSIPQIAGSDRSTGRPIQHEIAIGTLGGDAPGAARELAEARAGPLHQWYPGVPAVEVAEQSECVVPGLNGGGPTEPE